MIFIDWIKNLTLVNKITVGITLAILITGVALAIYFHFKLKALDGLIGILPPKKEIVDDGPGDSDDGFLEVNR